MTSLTYVLIDNFYILNAMYLSMTLFWMVQVYMSQVVTESKLVDRSSKLEMSLQSGNHPYFIESKLANMKVDNSRYIG